MSIEYKDRGAFHRIVNNTKFKPHQSKNALVKLTAKSALRMETARLFVTDMATNRLVGKEFHIKFDRQKEKNGKYRTKFKIVRSDAPIYKEKGILHRASDINRRFEGDVPTFLKKEISFLKPAHKTVLGSETVLIKLGDVGINKLKLNARNEVDNFDTGKGVLSAISTVKTLNNARKAVINHRIKKTNYVLKKASFKVQKQQLKNAKKDLKINKPKKKLLLKSKKSKFKQAKRDYKANKSSQKKEAKYLKIKQEYKVLKKLKRFDKKGYKNQKKRFKNIKQQKRLYYTAPLVIKGGGAVIGKVTASIYQRIITTDSNNDFLTATSKITNVAVKVNQACKNHNNKTISKSEKKLLNFQKKKIN